MSQLCMKWNNYESGIIQIFQEMYESENLCDVTIACEGQSLLAHKLVLSACSPYFQSLFMANPCKHPIVILKDVEFADLRSLVEFMYRGEVTVPREQLASLLKTAETLQIKQLAELVKKPSYEAASAHAVPAKKRKRRSRRGQGAMSGGDGMASESESEAPASNPSPSKQQVQHQVIYFQDSNPEGGESEGQMNQDAQASRILEVSMAELVGAGGEEVSGEVHEEGTVDEHLEEGNEEDKGEESMDANQLNVLSALFANDSDNSIMLIKKKLSFVWEYFHETGKGSVKCKKCGKLLSYKDTSGSTSNMIKHLKTVHSVERAAKPPLQE